MRFSTPPGPAQVCWLGLRIDELADSRRHVVGADSRRRPLRRIDADGKCGAVGCRVGIGHQRQVQLIQPVRLQRHANQPPGLGLHEVDRLRSAELRRADKVSLVFTVWIINHDHHAAVGQKLGSLFHAGDYRLLFLSLSVVTHFYKYPICLSFSSVRGRLTLFKVFRACTTAFTIMSASIFTTVPVEIWCRLVEENVEGMIATAKL